VESHYYGNIVHFIECGKNIAQWH